MKSAEEIAREIIPEPNTIPVQGNPDWVREEIEDVLRPLLAVIESLDLGRPGTFCPICRHVGWHSKTQPKPCPVPAALEAAKS